MSGLKIEDIQIFLKLARTRSFSTTADALFLSPSAVTYSIKNLEKQLGAKLFHRSSHGVALTEKGELFYRDMRRMMADWETALEHLREEKKEQKILRVGLISMTLQRDFSNIISRFIEENPDVQPKLSVCPVEDPTALLRKKKQDVAFIYGDAIGSSPLLNYEHLVSVPMYCVVSRENALAARREIHVEDLVGQTLFILPDEINATVAGLMKLGERVASLGEKGPTRISADDYNYCLGMVADNRGISFSPVYPPTLLEPDTLRFLPFRDPEIHLDIYVSWPRGSLSLEAESLVAIARRYFSA